MTFFFLVAAGREGGGRGGGGSFVSLSLKTDFSLPLTSDFVRLQRQVFFGRGQTDERLSARWRDSASRKETLQVEACGYPRLNYVFKDRLKSVFKEKLFREGADR